MTSTAPVIVSGQPLPVVTARERQEDIADLRGTIRSLTRLGLALIALFALGFGTWATLVPLAGGAVAPGVISPDGSRRTIQHLEGGIIGRLLVRDGDEVEAGEPLLTLEDVQPRASYQMLLGQQRTLLATRARLTAELLGQDAIDFPPALLAAADDPGLRAIVEGQRRIFETRRATHLANKRVLQQRIQQLDEQIVGLQAQVESAGQQLVFIADELTGKQKLLAKDLITKPEVLRLQRAEAEIAGERGEYLGSIASARQRIGETELQLLALDSELADEIATELDGIRAELADVEEKLLASEDVLNRSVVTAPVSGTVVGLRFKTVGGVVGPGEPILDIVPAEDNLLIDARISPNDIDVVHQGLEAQIHLTAYSNRSTPRVRGVVRSISADRIADEQQPGQAYYLARVEVDRDELQRIGDDIQLVAGMPAEVLIVTGERTMLQYLTQPFVNIFRRSFRET